MRWCGLVVVYFTHGIKGYFTNPLCNSELTQCQWSPQFMKTSWHETFFIMLLVLCEANPLVWRVDSPHNLIAYRDIFRVTGPLWGKPPVTGDGQWQASLLAFDGSQNKSWNKSRVVGDLKRHDAHAVMQPWRIWESTLYQPIETH